MESMAISQFKAHALKIIDQVAKSQEPLIITKRGQPLAQIIPYQETVPEHKPGQLQGTLVFEEDLLTPLGEKLWEVCS